MSNKRMSKMIENLITLSIAVRDNTDVGVSRAHTRYLCGTQSSGVCSTNNISCHECILNISRALEDVQELSKKLKALALLED